MGRSPWWGGLIALLTLLGCGDRLDVTGSYEIDRHAILTDLRERAARAPAGEPDPQLAQVEESLRSLVVAMELRDDQTFTMTISRSETEADAASDAESVAASEPESVAASEPDTVTVTWSQSGMWVLEGRTLRMTAKGEDGGLQTLVCPLRDDGSLVIDDGRQRLVMRRLSAEKAGDENGDARGGEVR